MSCLGYPNQFIQSFIHSEAYIDCSQKYHIKIIPNRTSYRACYDTVEYLKEMELTSFFRDFGRKLPRQKADQKEKIEITKWFNRNISKNIEQKQAVQNILKPNSLPISIRGFWTSRHRQNKHSGGSCDPDLEKSTKEQDPDRSSVKLGL
jgi:hypothetical protein